MKLEICANDGCENTFEKKTHNQKYCSDECCREATNRKIKEKYYAKKQRLRGEVRYCADKCGTQLSRYNADLLCNVCAAKPVANQHRSILNMVANVSR